MSDPMTGQEEDDAERRGFLIALLELIVKAPLIALKAMFAGTPPEPPPLEPTQPPPDEDQEGLP